LKWDKDASPILPMDGHAVQTIEQALCHSPTKSILLEINQTVYQLSMEGRWFKFSLLTKKNTVKRSAIFQSITEVYNQSVHGHSWRISQPLTQLF
jgi:hypothetical protein